MDFEPALLPHRTRTFFSENRLFSHTRHLTFKSVRSFRPVTLNVPELLALSGKQSVISYSSLESTAQSQRMDYSPEHLICGLRHVPNRDTSPSENPARHKVQFSNKSPARLAVNLIPPFSPLRFLDLHSIFLLFPRQKELILLWFFIPCRVEMIRSVQSRMSLDRCAQFFCQLNGGQGFLTIALSGGSCPSFKRCHCERVP